MWPQHSTNLLIVLRAARNGTRDNCRDFYVGAISLFERQCDAFLIHAMRIGEVILYTLVGEFKFFGYRNDIDVVFC